MVLNKTGLPVFGFNTPRNSLSENFPNINYTQENILHKQKSQVRFDITLFTLTLHHFSDDEINLIERGKNYGWPNVAGFCNTTTEQAFCATNNIVEPLIAWTPTIAPAGLTYYNSTYIPQFRNSLLLALLKDSKLMQLKLNDDQTKIESTTNFFMREFGRLRAVCQSPDGKIYICTSNGSADKIIEISK